ncbi:alpha/beta fold hydrolase [Nocardia pseudobrasiliensis]|uniref:Pimeloyl-ACP methyl ester carboxylesterase n=1 Tax=Nocardia pseudobrasiliensis TaxID=45979 RepID=A0A370I2G3_9NOCA|nr:alpha/beta fold hydrolase [Nocardia pseudobrasiliensis]RDI64886.1 pimeloyl-ACP methyl ester carboxylesterase [Nocardia pseudobrasiliensis]
MINASTQRFHGRDGVELAYRELGIGRPLVLLHGIVGNGAQWVRFGPATALAEKGYRVIMPDLRGHGDSAHPDDARAYPPDVLAEDGLALIEHLGLDDYDLGGYSLGGRMVLRMVVHGARPARVIVGGQGLDSITRGSDRNDIYRRTFTAMAEGRALESGSQEADLAYWTTRTGADPRALRHIPDSVVATTEAELRRIDIPALILVGDHDPYAASADALAAALPRGRRVPIPGDHFSALAAPELTSAVADFLAEVSR